MEGPDDVPGLFCIAAVQITAANPCPYPIYINENVLDPLTPECSRCRMTRDVCRSCLVQGYDEFYDVDPGRAGFWGCAVDPLFASKQHATAVASSFSGCELVEVGYDDWEQQALPESEHFTHPPLIGAVSVETVCTALLSHNGTPLDTCPECGTMYGLNRGTMIETVQVVKADWPGTDFARIWLNASPHILVTGDAIDRLRKMGFGNLEFREVPIV